MKLIILLIVAFTIANAWKTVPHTGGAPSGRGGGTMEYVECRDELIIFGGYYECFNASACDHEFKDELYVFDLVDEAWCLPSITPDPTYGAPGPRAFPASTLVEISGEVVMLVYGGSQFAVQFETPEQWFGACVPYEDLWVYYTEQKKWERIITTGGPGPRAGAGLKFVDGKVILSSGINTCTFTSIEDTWELDIDTWTWTALTGRFSTYEEFPELDLGRYIFPFEESEDKLYAFSGNIIPVPPLLGVQYQDLWEYDPEQEEWRELAFGDSDFTGRVHCGGAIFDEKYIIFFGDDNNNAIECSVNSISSGQSPVNETWVYDLDDEEEGWLPIRFNDPVPALKRIFYASSKDDEMIWAWGGFDVTCANENEEITWNTELLSLDFSDYRKVDGVYTERRRRRHD